MKYLTKKYLFTPAVDVPNKKEQFNLDLVILMG